MLRDAYQFDRHEYGEMALYNPVEVPWSALPDRCVMMTHWHRVDPLVSLLEEHDFLVVTLARHPLDVLLSILQYSPCEGSLRWLEGLEGDERPIFRATPQSEEFQRYATGPRARALLAVSTQWWTAPGCHRIRYEDLVGHPQQSLFRLSRTLGVAPSVRFDEAVEVNRMGRLRTPATARHFWQGTPGLWRSLLAPDHAHRIARSHREVFSTLGYSCNPDLSMDDSTATRNWLSLTSTAPRNSSSAPG
jgi:hypothetical protein